MPDSDNPFAKYGRRTTGENPFAQYGPRTEPQVGGAEALWRRLMSGLGAPRAEEYRAASPADSLWEHIKSAGSQAISQGAPTALTAIGGAGPTSAIGRIGLGAATGALSAASQPGTVSQRLGQAASGAAIGGAGGALGEAIGGAIAPHLAPDAATLARGGMTALTPGQRGGPYSMMREFEELAASQPRLRPRIAEARARSLEDFGRATINKVLEPVGMRVPQQLAGHDAVKWMGDAIGKAYGKVFSQVPRVDIDKQLIGQMAQIELNVRGKPLVWDTLKSDWNEAFRNAARLSGAIGPRGGSLRIPTMSGAEAQKAMSVLDAKARELLRSNNRWERDVGQILHDARGDVLDAIGRQYPQVIGDLRQANEAWAMGVRVENAARQRAGSLGRFTPMDLLQASRAASSGVRQREFARGDSILQDWAETAQRVLPSTLGESGTTPRASLLNPMSWGAGFAGSPIYRAMAARSTLQGPVQMGAGEIARRLPPTVAPYLGGAWARQDGIGPQGGYITGIGLPNGQ